MRLLRQPPAQVSLGRFLVLVAVAPVVTWFGDLALPIALNLFVELSVASSSQTSSWGWDSGAECPVIVVTMPVGMIGALAAAAATFCCVRLLGRHARLVAILISCLCSTLLVIALALWLGNGAGATTRIRVTRQDDFMAIFPPFGIATPAAAGLAAAVARRQ